MRWKRDLGGGQVTTGPVIGVDGSLVVATNAGVIEALDPSTGKTRWSFDGGGGYGNDLSTSPSVLADGTIVWPGRGNNLSALEVTAGDHRTVWTVDLGGVDDGSPPVGPDGTIYTTTGDAEVAVRDLGDEGAELWRFPTRKLVEVSSAVSPDGIVVVGTNNDREYGLKPDGTVAWDFDIDGYTYSSAAVRPDGTGYFGDNNGVVRTFDPTTGEVTRSVKPEEPEREHVWTSVVVDGTLYLGTTSGTLYAIG